MSSPPSPAYSSSPNTSPSPPPPPPPGSPPAAQWPEAQWPEAQWPEAQWPSSVPPAPQFQQPTVRPEELESRRGLMQAYRDSMERVAGMLGEHSQTVHGGRRDVRLPVLTHASGYPAMEIQAGISENEEIEEVGEGEQLQQVETGEPHPPAYLEIEQAAAQEPSPPQDATLPQPPPRAPVPGYIRILAFPVTVCIAVMIYYEATINGGLFGSDSLLSDLFPLLAYLLNNFRETNVCDFYHWKMLLIDSIFQWTAVVAIISVEISLATTKKCRFLILLLVGSSVHAFGSLLSGLARAQFEPMIFIGRSLSGFGAGLLIQGVTIILEVVGADDSWAARAWTWCPLLGPIAANGVNLMISRHSSGAWRFAFLISGAASSFVAVLVVGTLLFIRWTGAVAPDNWSYHWASWPRKEARHPLYIEVVRTVATPLLDLNLYNFVILMLLDSSTEMTYRVSLGISIGQGILLVLSYLVVRYQFRGRRIQAIAALVMGVMQIVTTVVLARHGVHQQVARSMGVPVLVLQALFIIGYSLVSNPSTWIRFPLADSIKEVDRVMPALSMFVQGGIAFLAPRIICWIGIYVFLVWGVLALAVGASLYFLVPDTWDAADEGQQVQMFRQHKIWKYLYD